MRLVPVPGVRPGENQKRFCEKTKWSPPSDQERGGHIMEHFCKPFQFLLKVSSEQRVNFESQLIRELKERIEF